MSNEEVYVGIDVSKAHLDVSVSSPGLENGQPQKVSRRCLRVWAA